MIRYARVVVYLTFWFIANAATFAAEPFKPSAVADVRGQRSQPQTVAFPVSGNPTGGVRVYVTLPAHRTPETLRVTTRIETTGAAATADRTFTVTLTPRGHSLPTSTVTGRFDVTLPQNAARAEAIHYVPKTSYGTDYLIAVAEDGRVLPGFEAIASFINRPSDPSAQVVLDEFLPQTLVITDQWLPPVEAAIADLICERSTSLSPGVAADWRAYQPFDFVVLSQSRYEDLTDTAAEALRRWVRCGGNLVLTDTTDAQRDDETQQSLDVRHLSATAYWQSGPGGLSIRDPMQDYYNQQIRRIDLNQWLDEIGAEANAYARSQIPFEEDLRAVTTDLWDRIAEQAGRTGEADEPLTVQDIGAGRIFRTAGSIDRPAGLLADLSVAQSTEVWRSKRLMRRGADPILGSQRFAAWLIPGLGQPPVYSFIALLVIFTLLVGPFAYYKTSRGGRTYLMFIIAPVLAIVTTTAMILYGVVADGFDTHVRVRQITWLDGQSGDAATRTRSTYFAGIRPSGGLTFDPNADLTLLPDGDGRPWWERQTDRPGPPRIVDVTDAVIRCNGNFLPSRQQRQFITTQPRDDFGTLTLTAGSTARHSFPVTLRQLVLRDAAGGLHHGVDVGPKTEMVLKPLTTKEAGELLGDLYTSEWLVNTRVDQDDSRLNRRNVGLTDLATTVSYEFDDATKPLEGLFEYELQVRMQLSSQLTAGSFVAVADLTDDALAYADAIPTNSIHFIFGSVAEVTP